MFKTKVPIIQAGMGPYDTTKLATAVAKAGALGLISTVGMGSFKMPGIGEFKYSVIFGEGTPEELLESSMNHVLNELVDQPSARFGINIPVSEEFIPTAARRIKYVIERVKSDPAVKKKCDATTMDS
ncbi:MAG TPA: nitronate monooxygenase [Candidatus Lokiarchaeia archaeon]|nr:nitronate monooxygenase [Candidatus Lokiarchaeia archaeon]